MADQGPLASSWAERAKAFFDGTPDAFDSLFAADCVWDSAQGRLEGSAAIQAALEDLREATVWQSHEIVSSSEADGLLALLGRNTYGAGATTHVAAGVRFVDGKVTEIRSVGGLPEGSP
jgi:hypothetical protein